MVECIPRYEEVCDPVPVLVHDWTRSKVLQITIWIESNFKKLIVKRK